MSCRSVNEKSGAVALLTALTFVLSLTSSTCLAEIHGDVGLLKTVALQHKANFESLATWKGEAFEERTGTCGEPKRDYMIRNKCIFAYDKLQDAARWNKEPQEHRFVVDGNTPRDILASNNSAMIKGQYSYKYSASGQREGKDVYILEIHERKQAGNWATSGLAPQYLFCKHGAAEPMYEKLMWMYNNANLLKASTGNELYLKRKGNLVTWETWMPEHKFTEKYVFDLSTGGNLIEYVNESPSAETVEEFQYELQSGVWVPKSYKYRNITGKETGIAARKSSRTIRWSNSVVNAPFEEDEFTFKKLGVKHGDRISNSVIRRGYEYDSSLTDSEILKEPVSLLGKALPELKEFKLKVNPKETTDRQIVVCFWNMNHRPSRHMVQELAKKAPEFKQMGVAVYCVHASAVEKSSLDKWVKENKIPFDIGMIEGDASRVRSEWGVKSLPWLILADNDHTVRAEGQIDLDEF